HTAPQLSYSPYSGTTRALQSFPTRRSSDLIAQNHCDSAGTEPLRNSRTHYSGTDDCGVDHFLDRRLRSSFLVVFRQKKIANQIRSEEHTSELQSLAYLVCRLLLEKKNQLES